MDDDTPRLHMTKVAYGAQSLAEVHAWFARRGPEARLTTRYLPKRHAEMVGGSLFWVLKHQLVARSPILGFEEAEGGKTHIVISTQLIDVHPVPRRAHQGWRYLEDKDAPRDLAMGEAGEALPAGLAGELAKLGLV
ncbi:DUF1489 family protein [Novosphingobium sp. EMRT-2]|uniref:DUF1489 family protein n=1 Tax=Novosphingobium sp. EMRT-2 TaxID=2571749 RepID=UPI0010BDB969|nr:DUF1489 domain-containing protein [Novosphingobium sp. EMRT-2]QCI94554.1 DUF1489 family protein [Novosphingobium sp. EMRT-2]